MHCGYVGYMTHYDNVLCCWLVAKPIDRLSEVPLNIRYPRTLQLAYDYTYSLCIPVVSKLAHRVVVLSYA